MQSVFLPDEDATIAFGQQLANVLQQERQRVLVFLLGELGAGKTALTRAVVQALGYQGRVKSPTYTLVEMYEVDDRNVYHFDLYRLADPEELEFLGVRDCFSTNALCFIEWPQRGEGVLPAPDITLRLQNEGTGRALSLASGSPIGHQVLARLVV